MNTSKKYVCIGACIVVALLMFIVLLCSLGGSGLFASKATYTMYFPRSVKGLSIGAPVMFRGIRIGRVSKLSLFLDGEDGHFPVEVTVELESEPLKRGELAVPSKGRKQLKQIFNQQAYVDAWLGEMVKAHGLAAQLQTSSLLTGQMYIALEMSSEPASARDLKKLDQHIIPTRGTHLDRLYSTLQNVESTEILKRLLFDLSDFVSSGKAKLTMDNVYQLSEDAKLAAQEMRQVLSTVKVDEKMLVNLSNASEKMVKALDQANELIAQVKQETPAVFSKVNTALDGIPAIEKHAEQVLVNVETVSDGANATISQANQLIAPDSPERIKLEKTLDELDKAVRSMRELTEMLNRRPEVLIRGK